ncbi:hypothetical protein MKW92_048880 [Papaver armeniacum]|nr:hypothetical protein MKW92_048880 [Papaver armeniacum]
MASILSFFLRIFQGIFALSALILMAQEAEFYGYTVFVYLVIVMLLVIPWSLTLAVIDGHAVLTGAPPHHPRMQKIIIVGDCSSAGVISLLPEFQKYGRYQLSTTMAFFAWIPTAASALINLWLLLSM